MRRSATVTAVVVLLLIAIGAAAYILRPPASVRGPEPGATTFRDIEPTLTQRDRQAALPLGNRKYVTDRAQKGYVFVCEDDFSGIGSHRIGEWIDEEGGRWYPTKKPAVRGSLPWEEAHVEIRAEGDRRIIETNSLPVGHTTGIFPIRQDDPAYQYDRNPNPIRENRFSVSVPKDPVMGDIPSCLPHGPIAFTLTGVPMFFGLSMQILDAAAYELLDACGGQTAEYGTYHYHAPALFLECLKTPGMKIGPGDREAALVGYALDGFGLFSQYESGKELLSPDLDECHGHRHAITWDGVARDMYHYHVTRDFPYVPSCFRGSEVAER